VGLGAYTSIISNNGLDINDYEIPITTGNAYTTGLTVQGLYKAATLRSLDLAHAKVAVVGATGNIGLVMSQILLPRVGELLMVGSGQGESQMRLNIAKKLCLQELLESINTELSHGISFNETEVKGAGRIIYELLMHNLNTNGDTLLSQLQLTGYSRDLAEHVDKLLTQNNELIKTSTNIEDIANYDVVVVATNSEKADLITPSNVKHNAIVCCASVPSNLSHEFKNMPDCIAFDGGLALLPEDSAINFVGMPKHGLSYGCLAETIALVLDGHNHSFSKGTLTSNQVMHMMQVATNHHLSLGRLTLHGECVDSDII
jgi:predicted amino acid dehydrogenase